MFRIKCSWILLHAISNYWDVYGANYCVISDRVECFYRYSLLWLLSSYYKTVSLNIKVCPVYLTC